MDDHLQRIIDKVQSRSIAVYSPLSEHDVQAFEREHGVRLPEGYRSFLIHVGNGGRGPDELFKLGQYPGDVVPKPEYVDLRDLHKPFPFTEMKVWEGRCSYEEYAEDLSRLHYGNLCLSCGGCAQHYHLIVTGPERGNVWDFAWDCGIGPAEPEPEFLAWYEAWLDSPASRYQDPSGPVRRPWWKFW